MELPVIWPKSLQLLNGQVHRIIIFKVTLRASFSNPYLLRSIGRNIQTTQMILSLTLLTFKVSLNFREFPFTYTINKIFMSSYREWRLFLFLSLFLFLFGFILLFFLIGLFLCLFFHVDIGCFAFILYFYFLGCWDYWWRLLVLMLRHWERIECSLHILVWNSRIWSVRWRIWRHWRHHRWVSWHHSVKWGIFIEVHGLDHVK